MLAEPRGNTKETNSLDLKFLNECQFRTEVRRRSEHRSTRCRSCRNLVCNCSAMIVTAQTQESIHYLVLQRLDNITILYGYYDGCYI